MPKIDLVIYKGIKKSSLIAGAKVANASLNDLTQLIHENTQLWYESQGTAIPDTEPASSTSLGLIYNASSSENEYIKSDEDSLNEVFFASNDVTLPYVSAGHHIGDFDSSQDFGIMIVFESIGFKPRFTLARTANSVITFEAIDGNASVADAFRRKHEKEKVLSFLDSAAFYGAFGDSGLRVFDASGNDQVITNLEELYSEIVSKHYNRNKVYLDLRSENNDSFNYYENYNNNIRLSLDNSESLTDFNYYRNDGWPVFVLDSTEFGDDNINKIIKLGFYRGDNEHPLLYYRRVYKTDLNFELPSGEESFIAPPIIDDTVRLEDFQVRQTADNAVVSDYVHIKIIKRVNLENDGDGDFPSQGYSLFKRSYLDNLFPIFDMHIPFLNTDYTNLKVFFNESFVDKMLVSNETLNANLTDYSLRDFIPTIGVASDNTNITFVAFPHVYHTNTNNNNDFIPVSSMESSARNPFLIELNNTISQVNIVRSSFTINGTESEYLTIQNNQNEDQVASNYSFDDVILLSITREEYQQLETLKNDNFNGPYKVYMGVKNVSVLTDDNGNSYSSFTYVLRGLSEVDGEIVAHEVNSTITSITDAQIIGVESGHIFPTPTPYVSSDYGWRILNGQQDFHDGIDIVAPMAANTSGTPIYAVKGGVVTRLVTTEDGNGGGVRVRIRSDDNENIEYNYFHLLVNSNSHLSIGQTVAQGDQIGQVGSTGSSNAPHLHFEIWNGTLNRINPFSIFPELALLPYTRHRDD